MPKFRKKPIVIEAIQFVDHASGMKILEWAGDKAKTFLPTDDFLSIRTLEGVMKASLNDWVIKGVNDEFNPCKPDIFEKTYEPVVE